MVIFLRVNYGKSPLFLAHISQDSFPSASPASLASPA
ncbi:hypothetical protein cce_3243 [Crocosphaera subtropica ATCC 51142]|uniref:Uncharacterized protein n=1 Tax=Crocosphaera subtropica (strain ATCC 51142 / BH68) TaxID=43989 RepID=B1WXQ0_CROS5|nr:hypothetical protein cce_3243 [Crocosphaera subtropica ATCC 51142]